MNGLMTIKNVRGYMDKTGTAHLHIEDVARGLGFTQTKNNIEYVRWETVNGYLKDFNFSQQVGKDGFIPENIFYKLCFKAENETARKFQDLVTDEILPAIRKTGGYVADDDLFINTYLPMADETTKTLFKGTLEVVRNQNEIIMGLKNENETLEIALNTSIKFFTVAKYNDTFHKKWSLNKCQLIGKQMSAYCRTRAIEIRKCKTNDERFGTVNSYPISAWEDFMEVFTYA